MDEVLKQKFESILARGLDEENDLNFWVAALDTFLCDIDMYANERCRKFETFLQLGACSRWFRPHASRWSPDGVSGSFAYPLGYQTGILGSLPEIDVFVLLHWDWEKEKWHFVRPKYFGKRKLIFRASLPTRTKRHPQAAIHTVWSPGSPEQPNRKATRFYGFQKKNNIWECVATHTWRVGNKNKWPEETWVK